MKIISIAPRRGFEEMQDNKGNRIYVNEKATLKQLVAAGVRHIGILPNEEKLPDHVYATLPAAR